MDRRTIATFLLLLGAVFLLTSEPWMRAVNDILGIEPPAKDTIPPAPQDPATPTPSVPAPAILSAPATPNDTVVPESAVVVTDTPAAPVDTGRVIHVHSRDLKLALHTRGARLATLQLRAIPADPELAPQIIDDVQGRAATWEVGEFSTETLVFQVPEGTPDTIDVATGDSIVLIMRWSNGRHLLERTWTVRDTGPSVGMSFRTRGLPERPWTLGWSAGLQPLDPKREGGPPVGFGMPSFRDFVWADLDGVHNHRDRELRSLSARTSWLGLRTRYTAAIVSFPAPADLDITVDTLPTSRGRTESWTWKAEGRWAEDEFARAELVAMPLEHRKVSELGIGLEKVLFPGWAIFLRADLWFPGLCAFLLHLLNLVHGVVPNYGVAIILLTILVRLVLLPLTMPQVRQARKMAQVMPVLKPRIEAIKEEFKGDSRKIQEETMKAYSEAGVNPLATMAGCLPMLLQIPVFIGLYMVLGRAIELRSAPFAGWVTDLSAPDVVLEAVRIPLLFPVGITILPLFMALSMYFLNKQTMKDPSLKPLVYLLPIIMLLFSGTFPSGLVLYWTVSNLASMAQTWILGAPPITGLSGMKSPPKPENTSAPASAARGASNTRSRGRPPRGRPRRGSNRR